MKELLLTLILGLFLVSLVSAELNDFAPVKQGECVTIKQSCSSCSYVNVSISYPNSSLAISNGGMASNGGGVWTYDFCNTTQLGRYDINGEGDLDGTATSFDSLYFEVTYAGIIFNTSQAILYFILLIVIMFVFFITLFGINKLPSSNIQDEEGKILSITYLKYLRPVLWTFEWMLIIAILFISSNIAFAYLGEQLFAKIIFTLFRISFGLTPIIIIVWLIWIFVSMFHDKQFQNMLNRGIFPQGKL